MNIDIKTNIEKLERRRIYERDYYHNKRIVINKVVNKRLLKSDPDLIIENTKTIVKIELGPHILEI